MLQVGALPHRLPLHTGARIRGDPGCKPVRHNAGVLDRGGPSGGTGAACWTSEGDCPSPPTADNRFLPSQERTDERETSAGAVLHGPGALWNGCEPSSSP